MQACRVLNHVTWQPLLECGHRDKVAEPAHVVVYQEVSECDVCGMRGCKLEERWEVLGNHL